MDTWKEGPRPEQRKGPLAAMLQGQKVGMGEAGERGEGDEGQV